MVKHLAEENGAENLVVVFGINQPATLQIMTRTFTVGDPSYAGALAGVSLGLACYHIFELSGEIPEDVWQAEMSMYELELEKDERTLIIRTMNDLRQD